MDLQGGDSTVFRTSCILFICTESIKASLIRHSTFSVFGGISCILDWGGKGKSIKLWGHITVTGFQGRVGWNCFLFQLFFLKLLYQSLYYKCILIKSTVRWQNEKHLLSPHPFSPSHIPVTTPSALLVVPSNIGLHVSSKHGYNTTLGFSYSAITHKFATLEDEDLTLTSQAILSSPLTFPPSSSVDLHHIFN